MRTIYLPRHGTPVCGHTFPGGGFGDLPMGREETIDSVVRKGVRYAWSVIRGPCSKCNAEQDKRIEREIAALERAERNKATAKKQRTAHRKKSSCDVFMGLCGSYNEDQRGKCDNYSCMFHDRVEPDLRDRIAHCEHRKLMNSRALRKAVKLIGDYLQSTK